MEGVHMESLSNLYMTLYLLSTKDGSLFITPNLLSTEDSSMTPHLLSTEDSSLYHHTYYLLKIAIYT